jgi:formylglycine-generating enzyme required for sulfatase activity
LIVSLHELGREAGDIRDFLRGVNDVAYGGKVDHALRVTTKLLAVHLPEPNDRVVHALQVLYRAVRNLRPPPVDEELEERTETRKKLWRAVGGLRMALDDTWEVAKRAYPGGEPIPVQRKNITSRASKAQVTAFLAELDAFQAVVDEVAGEEKTASTFAQQGELVTFYVRDMTFEIDVARLHLTVNNTSLDFGALVNTIEEVRDVTDRFRSTVTEWVGRVADGLVNGTETLAASVRRLVAGVRALGGMIDDGDPDDGDPDDGDPDDGDPDDGDSDDGGPEMVVIPKGSFIMGIPESESKRLGESRDKDARPRHRVTFRRPFLLGKFPVTRGEYAEFARQTHRPLRPPRARQTDRHPVVNVSFADAIAYAEWLSKQTGRSYRLPGEAEWEYACRAGTETARPWGDETNRKLANFGVKVTTEVDAYPPNPWGLHDMLGNTWEWVQDTWHENYVGAPVDGAPWIGDASIRVQRGGSQGNVVSLIRSGVRVGWDARTQSVTLGFRLARDL